MLVLILFEQGSPRFDGGESNKRNLFNKNRNELSIRTPFETFNCCTA